MFYLSNIRESAEQFHLFSAFWRVGIGSPGTMTPLLETSRPKRTSPMTAIYTWLTCLTTLAAEPVRRDALGDSLPGHAVARLGTDRLGQHWSRYLEFSPNDQLLVGIDSVHEFRVWDVASGRLLWVSPMTEKFGHKC